MRAAVAAVCALVLLGCGRSAETSRSQPKAEGPRARSPSDAPTPSYDDLHALVAQVSRTDRARAEAAREALWSDYEKSNIKAKTLFNIPTKECCPSPDEECEAGHLRFAGLCYSNPRLELWGLGPLAIDDDGLFWIYDAVVSRAVAFDRNGKLVDAVRMTAAPEDPGSLVVTPTELWLDSFSAGDDPAGKRLLRVDRKTRETRSYHWAELSGRDYQDRGWLMPGNSSRIPRWSAHWQWDVVDVSFLDDTHMQISTPRPLHARGHRYWLDCDFEGKRPATLVIDDHAVPAPGCLQVEYVGPNGDTVAGIPFYHFDVHGNVIGVATRVQRDFDILTGGRDTAVGPDGNAYQYIPHEHSVQFVELPWFSR